MVSVNVIHHVYLLKWEILLYCWVQLLATNIYVSKGSGHDPLLSSHCHMLLLLPTIKVQVQNEYIIKKEKKKEKKRVAMGPDRLWHLIALCRFETCFINILTFMSHLTAN